MKCITCTLQLIYFALFPPSANNGERARSGVVTYCTPGDVAAMERFLDAGGEFRVVFADCLPIAAPFVLFRLKRQGFSRCSVRAGKEGLLVEGMR